MSLWSRILSAKEPCETRFEHWLTVGIVICCQLVFSIVFIEYKSRIINDLNEEVKALNLEIEHINSRIDIINHTSDSITINVFYPEK